MEGACGQDRPGVTSVSPFANPDLEKRAKVCSLQEQARAESSVLPGFLLQFVLVQLLAEGAPVGQDFTLAAPRTEEVALASGAGRNRKAVSFLSRQRGRGCLQQ